MVPPAPPVAVKVVFVQKDPAPETATAAGTAFTVIVIFADVAVVVVTHPAEVVITQETN